MTLIEFLLARIADDEQTAASVGGARFESWNRSWDAGPQRDLAVDGVRTATLPMTIDEHVCRWDPARVLAECEAKRLIIQHAGRWEVVSVEDGRRLHHPTMLALAAVYSDHPDYREEWRP